MYDEIFAKGIEIVKKIEETQEDALQKAAALIADAYASGHHFFVSGSGHSHTVAEEFYGRAGGLAFIISRAHCKKKLMELADVVIDNCGVTGDACLDVEGIETKMMPTSSIANAFIVQTLSVLCAQDLLAKGVEVPVFESLNADTKINRNDEYYERFTRLY